MAGKFLRKVTKMMQCGSQEQEGSVYVLGEKSLGVFLEIA
jgi:hypothetical protein